MSPAAHTHLPAEHVKPLAHELQVLPPLPQADPLCTLPATQVLPLQQPLGQEAALQTHAPALQTWPLEQAWPQAPQLLASV
ncbi:MAG: hypothetical protein ABUR63_01190 [Verrucomicrobiota bacterium]